MGRFPSDFGKARAQRTRLALVVRVENLAVLARCIGLGQTAAVLSILAARIGVTLGVPAPIPSGPDGQIAVLLPARGAERGLRAAIRIQALLQAGVDLPGSAPAPIIAAALIEGAADVPPERLFDAGREQLRRLAPGPGRVILVRMPDAAADDGALDLSEVGAWFQPQLCCNSGRITGFEVLARLGDAERGTIEPADFLPRLSTAEQRRLTRSMLSQGLAALHRWGADGFEVGTVSVNLSAADATQPDFADFVLWELDRQDLAPSRLVLEVTEEISPLDAPDVVAANLSRLAALGCGIELDDFGTGYSSFEALRRLPVRRIKIDRSFIAGCDRDPAQQRMIVAMLKMAESLQIDTVAEGVETAEELAFAAQIGCSHAQGYAVARPMRLDDTPRFLATRARDTDMPSIRRRA